MSASPSSTIEVNAKNEKNSIDQWEQIGFHRPLGGFMYNYVLGFVGLIFGVLVGGLLISLLYPYPESKGYRDLAGMVFVWLIPIIDFGIAYGIERLIAEWRVKDREKMLEFIRFFMWYNFMSSLLKTTVFSIWTFIVIRNGNLAYLSWNLLFLAIQSYPGILYFLRATMVGFQQYHKAALLNLIGSEIFDKLFLLAMIFQWRRFGTENPALGELLTMSFGTTFAYYCRDYFMFLVQIYVMKPIVKQLGIPLKSFIYPKFSSDTVKMALKSGLSVSIIGLIGQVNSYFIVMLYWQNIMNYTTFSVLSSTAAQFINFIDYFGKIDLTAPFSEAYQNGKRKLAVFYIAQGWKYWGYVNGAMLITFLAFLNVLGQTITAIPGLENYALIGFFLMPTWIYKFFLPLAEQGDTILVSARKLKEYQFVRIFEEGFKIIWVLIMFYVLRWQDNGITAGAYVLILAVAVPQWLKTLIVWIYIKRHLISYQIPIWQALIAPLLSGGIVYGLITLILTYIYPLLLTITSSLGAGIITIVATLLLFPTIIFPFFYGLVGGWDEFGLKIYEKSASLAGPSKIFYKTGAKLTRWAAEHSALTNKFGIPNEEAANEITALMEMKQLASKTN